MKPILIILLLFATGFCKDSTIQTVRKNYLSIEYAEKNLKPKEIESNIETKNRFMEKNSLYEKKFNEALEFYKSKRYLESVAKFEDAMNDFTEAEVYYHYAKSLKSIGSFKDSISAFEIAEKLAFENKIYLYYNMAATYSLLSDLPKSVYYLKLAITNGFQQFKHLEIDSDFSNLKKQKQWNSIYVNLVSDQLLSKTPADFIANPNRKIKLKRFSKNIFLDTKENSVSTEIELFNGIIFFTETSIDKENRESITKTQGVYEVVKDRIKINLLPFNFKNDASIQNAESLNALSFELLFRKELDGFLLLDLTDYESKDFLVNKKDCSFNKEVGCETCRKEYVQKGYFCTY